MKKSLKRILCGALSVLTVSTLAVEGSVRMNADDTLNLGGHTATATAATFENVTGKFDTSAIRESNFNTTVEKDTNPTYETRTVMVTLSGDTVSERAEGVSVDEFITTWSGQRAVASIASEQKALCRYPL